MNRSATGTCTTFILLLACTESAGITVTFTDPVVLPMGGVGGDVTTADIDADGDIDIISTTRDPNLFWVSINDGAGNFAMPVAHAAGLQPRAVIAADLDNDGAIDIATANELGGGVTVMTGAGAGVFASPRHFATAFNPTELAVGDFNGDGLLDLAVTHKANSIGPLVVRLNGGGIGAGWLGFLPATNYNIGGGSRSVEVFDIDGDGQLDIVTTNRTDSTISVLLGFGDGTFDSALVFYAGPFPRDSVSGDFDGDGIVDLAIADFLTARIWVLFNRGSDVSGWLGMNSPSPWFTGGSGSHGIDAADLDLDNDLDLIVANVKTGNISVMINDGAGGFDDATVIGVGALSAASVAIADFDGDGDMDSVNSNAAAAGSISILLNITDTCPIDINNDGAVDTADLGILIGSFGTANGHVDLNGDGIVDTADLGILIGAFGSICP